VPDHGELVRLGLVGCLGGVTRVTLGREAVDQTLDLRKQIVGRYRRSSDGSRWGGSSASRL
jgi:hypothetical protein